MASSPEELERQVDRMLRSQPERQAPASLEARVMARLAAPAAAPWWRRSYAAWPPAVRLAFFLLSAGAAAVVAVALGRLVLPAEMQLRSAAASGGSWLAGWQSLVSQLLDVAAALLRRLPAPWLYGALAAMAAGYATLIGLGSALYRHFRSSNT